jgi:hypothetical protein
MAKATNVNIDCSTRQSAQLLFDLKTLLLANGWTIVGTSDATNFTNGASPDNVTTAALFDVSNAWYVLADPSSLLWLYVQRRASNVTFTIKVSRVAPQANGTATALPTCATAADEVTVVSNTTFASSAVAARGHLITYDAAENAAGIRPVYVVMTQSTGTACGVFCIEAAANGTYASSNAYPWIVGWSTGNTIFDRTSASWRYYYSPTSVFSATTGFSEPNTTVTIAGNVGTGVDPWVSEDSAVPVLIGRNTSQTTPGIWGVMKNIRARGVARDYPNTMTTSGGERFVYVGFAVVPFADGVTPL